MPQAKSLMLLAKSKIADWQLAPLKGTILTGSVRSGTTLALRMYCPDLTVEEEKDGSPFNEYRPFSDQIIRGKVKTALRMLPLVMRNRHHLLKSPHIAFVLPKVKPKYRVIVTFRDLRLIVPSMLKHENVQRMILSDRPYWDKYTSVAVPEDLILRATLAAELHYTRTAQYRGPLTVWNYGFWDEWMVRNEHPEALYAREGETSKAILQDVKQGSFFSDKSFRWEVWDEFRESSAVSLAQVQAIQGANERIRELYSERGLEIKTLDDL